MIEKIKEDLFKAYIGKVDRLNHVYGVKNTAVKLAKIHGVDLKQTMIAAYLHDITKYEPLNFHHDMISSVYSEVILETYTEPLYHAYSAAAIAETKYGIKDQEIIQAIKSHAVGRPNMSLLEKIIFISDYIEPYRTYPSCVEVREIAFKDLDLAVYMAIKHSIHLYEKLGGFVPKVAYEALKFYREGGSYE